MANEDLEQPQSWNEIGILQRRTIEAAIIAPIYEELAATIGEASAQSVIDKAIRKAAIAAAQSYALKTEGGTSLQTFQDLQVLWTKDDALEIEVLQATDTVFDYDVHRCRYAETYKAMGLGHIGHLLSCNRDAVFCQGYDSRISMKRTQTLMGGATHCDFRYTFDAGANKRV
ncbi:L-2-amino-thiazoline-4-carboxylic acid hydrolase [Rhizobium sp. L245/93]|uniref:L-2-amino-thiazoline-4-carboxylic acid hydrolase n=1 Tax=Rhizobium sp. L245/93 TaxID=2819998 RepID=UPI001ADAC8D9|nr:L-2-amino-thiazoline-4-carboxylic acid hydrolase [Rhizobium sp. L245/93]MBO9170027.1 L-2-amino-thiazoline-4-carboxylic acid hydrolase [Rhizobium sp. L245/93]